MSADFEIDSPILVDTTASSLLPIYGTLSDDQTEFVPQMPSGPKWQGTDVTLRLGRSKNTADIFIPLLSIDEQAPAIAGITGTPIDDMLTGTPWKLYELTAQGAANIIFTGTQVDNDKLWREDVVVIHAECQKYDLEGVPVYGSLWYSKGDFSFRYSRRCIMNEKNQPNMTILRGIPCFCSPRQGLMPGQEPPTTPVEGVASYWTPVYSWKYFYNIFNNQDIYAPYILPKFPEFQLCPDNLDWADGLENALVETNLDGTNSIRKHAQIDFEDRNLFEVLNLICEQAGPYGIFCNPVDDPFGFSGSLQILRTTYNNTGAQGLYRSTAGNVENLNIGAVFNYGTQKESGRNLFTKATVSGMVIPIETTLSTVDGSLQWVDTDNSQFALWKQFIADQVSAGHYTNKQILNWANNQFPIAVQTLRINPDGSTYDFQDGTSEAGMPIASAPREFLEHLLTSYLPNGASLADRQNNVFPIRFEYSRDGGSTWLGCPNDHGMSRDDSDWSIWIEPLAAKLDPNGQAYTWSGNLNNATAITRTDIRVTLGVLCDHSPRQTLKLASDPTQSIDVSPVPFGDADKIQLGFSRHYRAGTELYAYELTHNSIVPLGTGSAGDNAPVTGTIRDDQSYQIDHVKRKLSNIGRLLKTGFYQYPHIFAQLRPGMQFNNVYNLDGNATVVDAYPVRSVAHEIKFESGNGKNRTSVTTG